MCLLMYLIFPCYCYAGVVHQFFRQRIYISVVHFGAFKMIRNTAKQINFSESFFC